MKRVPASRYVVFVLIAGGGLFADLFSKHVVFTDLGYFPDGRNNPDKPPVIGQHTLFDAPPRREGESRPYIEGWTSFRLFTDFNPGALWGIGKDWTWLFALLSVAAAGGVIYWLFVHKAAQNLWLTATLALIMAGTLGNLWDRTGQHGYLKETGETVFAVRDFLLFTFGRFNWPVFNFADVFLVTGAIMLVLQSFFADTDSSPIVAAAENSSNEPQDRALP